MDSQNFDTWFDAYFEDARSHQIDAEYLMTGEQLDQLHRPMDQDAIDQASRFDDCR